MSGIRLSKEFGLNPSIQVCYCCGEEMGIVLMGTSYKDKKGHTAEAPMKHTAGTLCDRCQRLIDEGGVFVIEVEDDYEQSKRRTGRMLCVKKQVFLKNFPNAKNINFMGKTLFSEVFSKVL